MRPTIDPRRMLATTVLLTGALVLFAGCEGDDVMRVQVPAQARIAVTFPQLTEKAEGDFDLDLVLRAHEGPEGPTEIHRTIPVRGWVAQGPLEVPARQMIMIDATTVLNGLNYTGFAQVMPLEPGTSAVVPLELFER